MKDRIRRYAHRGISHAGWYDRERHELARDFGTWTRPFLAIAAATSANASVSANASLALKAFRQYARGEPFTGYLDAVIDNLNRIREGNYVLKGPKIRAFALALLGDRHAVVVDRWMYRAYETESREAVVQNLRADAAKAGLYPRDFQAAVWCGIRGRGTPLYAEVRNKLGRHQITLNI